MKQFFLLICLALNLQAQELPNLREFVDFYNWTQGEGFQEFLTDTVEAAKDQIVLRNDPVYFTSENKFRAFFDDIAKQYRLRLNRLNKKETLAEIIQPEDLSTSRTCLTKLKHLWTHIFKNLSDNQLTLLERILTVTDLDGRQSMLVGWRVSHQKIIDYYIKWMSRIHQFYCAEKHWLSLIAQSETLFAQRVLDIKADLLSQEHYTAIEDFIPTLKGVMLACNATVGAVQRVNSEPTLSQKIGRGRHSRRKAPSSALLMTGEASERKNPD